AEYASSRRTLVCASATRLPTKIDNAASAASTGDQPATIACQSALPFTGAKPMNTIFPSTTNDATFEPEAMNAALGTGAPWYASGAHRWKGAAAILNANPTSVITIPTASNGWTDVAACFAEIAARLVVPNMP